MFNIFRKKELQEEDILAKWQREEEERKNAKILTLHFVDEMTGNTRTFEIPEYFTCGNLIDHAKDFGLIAKSPYSNVFYSIRELQDYRPYVKIKDTSLRSGDILHVVFEDAALLGRKARERFYQEYEVTVYWKEKSSRFFDEAPSDRCFAERIRCHGFDTKNGLERMLESKHREGRMLSSFTVLESCWPDYGLKKNGEAIEIKYLCQLSKEQKVVLYAEAAWEAALLYGCPVARNFQGSNILENCSVEIVDYE